MIRLIKNNLYRLVRSKVFWGVLLANIALNLLLILQGNGGGTFNNVPNMDNMFYATASGNSEIFGLLGFNLALVAGALYGAEYSNGTIRNKLITSNTRADMYFANFVTTVIIGLIFTIIYYFLVFAIGYPSFGGFSVLVTTQDIVWNVVCTLFIIFAYASIFTLIIMLSRNLTTGIMLSLLYVAVSMGIAYLLRDALDENEFMNTLEDGVYLGEVMNPAYISSPSLRKFVEIIISSMPAGQANELMQGRWMFDGVGASWQFMTSSACVATITNTTGYLIFRKIDLK